MKKKVAKSLVKVGLVIRGLLYMAVGLFGLISIFDLSKSPQNPNQIISQIEPLPLGKVLLVGIIIGVVGYALWGFVRIYIAKNESGSKIKRGAVSFGYLISALSYLLLAFPAIQILLNNSASQPINPTDLVQKVFSYPLGGFVILIIGLAVIVSGVSQMVYSKNKGFKDNLDLAVMGKNQEKLVDLLGRYGYFVRGLIYVILGVFLSRAGLLLHTTGVLSYAAVLVLISSLTFGPILLGLISLGLVALGLYSILSVKWSKLN